MISGSKPIRTREDKLARTDERRLVSRRQRRLQGMDRRRRRPSHPAGVGRGATLSPRSGMPALQPVRLSHRPDRPAVVPGSRTLLLVCARQRDRRDGVRRSVSVSRAIVRDRAGRNETRRDAVLDVTAMTPIGAAADRASRSTRSMTTGHGFATPARRARRRRPARPAHRRREFLRFLRSFGPTMFTVGETPVPGHPELNVVSNVGRAEPPRSTFHTDTSYVRKPPAFTALTGGRGAGPWRTDVVHQPIRSRTTRCPSTSVASCRGAAITHVVTGLQLGPDAGDIGRSSDLRRSPDVRAHLSLPVDSAALRPDQRHVAGTGRRNRRIPVRRTPPGPTTCTGTPGRPGDVVMWDNRCVLHRADHAGVLGERVMHRGMVADDSREQIGSGPG